MKRERGEPPERPETIVLSNGKHRYRELVIGRRAPMIPGTKRSVQGSECAVDSVTAFRSHPMEYSR